MIIEKTDYLDDDMLDLLTDLVLDVNEADKSNYTVPDDASYYVLLYEDEELCGDDELIAAMALYEMGETYGGKAVMEIVAFTGPKYRRQGYFELLLSSLKDELKGYAPRFALYLDRATEGTMVALKSVSAIYDHDELLMELKIKDKAVDNDKEYELYIECREGDEEEGGQTAEYLVSTPYGGCAYRVYGTEAYIYGITTYERFQNQGHAYAMLNNLFDYLLKQDISSFSLEVSSENTAAVKLYEKLGFKVAERLSYYYICMS